eukprot:m.75267 g.75267  ORF g.75267 m.75267 type:complete len:79 (+) comp11842_c0_seq2:285-521(+)
MLLPFFVINYIGCGCLEFIASLCGIDRVCDVFVNASIQYIVLIKLFLLYNNEQSLVYLVQLTWRSLLSIDCSLHFNYS